MSDPNERDAKLVQYLNEAYGKERELETALQVDIAITSKAPYKKRLKQHLSETKRHAKALERRIKQLGGGPATAAVQSVVGKATAVAKGPLHALRGSGEQEKMLKNAKTQYFNEHEEISTYLALETFATKVGDKETAKIAREIRREEERMARFLEGQVKSLAVAVALEEVPAAQRRTPRKASKRSSAKKATTAKPAARKATSKKSTAKKVSAKKASKSTARKATKKAAKAKTAKKPAARKTAKRKASSRK